MVKQIRKARKVGTIIKETAASYGVTDHTGCNCSALAAEMDALPTNELEQRLEEYTDKFLDSIKQWKVTGNWIEKNLVPLPTREEAQEFLIWAIAKSRAELAPI